MHIQLSEIMSCEEMAIFFASIASIAHNRFALIINFEYYSIFIHHLFYD